MVPVFEAGHLLALIRRFDEAARCFDHIAVDFPSREILSNAGLTRALGALNLFRGEADVRFVHPFEFDASTRLGRAPTGRAGEEDTFEFLERRRRYYQGLQEAAQWF